MQPHIKIRQVKLTLSLFVFRILTDNPDAPFSLNYFALLAHRFNWWSYFHSQILLSYKYHLLSGAQKSTFNIVSYHFGLVNQIFIYLSR